MNNFSNKMLAWGTKIIEKIADFLLPKDEKVKKLEYLGPAGLTEMIPRAADFDFETNSLKALFDYKNPLCRQAIWEIKYRANKKLIHDFGLLLYDNILEEIGDLKNFRNFKKIILIPIPSSQTRAREKGFNQCVLLTRELTRIDRERNQENFTLVENLLIKKVHTSRQSKTSDRKSRLTNVKDSFTINKNKVSGLKDCSFILIDDVITTGATMTECFRALRAGGARKIVGFALAH